MPLFKEVPVMENGELAMPTKPGLGLEFDRDALDRYRAV
jgi:L-alanine-DL-glutamate epimerase-like enolase superfamily enzyme